MSVWLALHEGVATKRAPTTPEELEDLLKALSMPGIERKGRGLWCGRDGWCFGFVRGEYGDYVVERGGQVYSGVLLRRECTEVAVPMDPAPSRREGSIGIYTGRCGDAEVLILSLAMVRDAARDLPEDPLRPGDPDVSCEGLRYTPVIVDAHWCIIDGSARLSMPCPGDTPIVVIRRLDVDDHRRALLMRVAINTWRRVAREDAVYRALLELAREVDADALGRLLAGEKQQLSLARGLARLVGANYWTVRVWLLAAAHWARTGAVVGPREALRLGVPAAVVAPAAEAPPAVVVVEAPPQAPAEAAAQASPPPPPPPATTPAQPVSPTPPTTPAVQVVQEASPAKSVALVVEEFLGRLRELGLGDRVKCVEESLRRCLGQ